MHLFIHLVYEWQHKFCLDCNSCCINKRQKLSFSNSTISSIAPLQYIYTDVWTSPLYSHDGLKYYIIFVDYFTKYIWLYPIKHNSKVKLIFFAIRHFLKKFSNCQSKLYTHTMEVNMRV